ncbi:hypothetical protein VDG1235_2633 [Verrucomicrobiia bacterium DG1235]|nr:hypothetical protein VDG1235_2633 [Verrucomicrobiae bacterium DG1235]
MNPFAADPSQAISSLGESKLIEQMQVWLGEANPAPPNGIGDDCAVAPTPTPNTKQLVTADPVIYGKHFNDSHSPEQAASKLARRNLSDIAAMGGRPTHAIICLALSKNVSISWIKRFYQTLAHEANTHQFKIIGGDVSSTDDFLGAFLTLHGETLPGTQPLLRKRAVLRSPLFVTGTLGGSLIQKHHAFTPRLAEGQWLAQKGACLTCTDISDGLGKDFANLLPSHLAAQIDCHHIPISEDAKTFAKSSGLLPMYHAFNDGEDYELLFALPPETDLPAFHAAWSQAFSTPLHQIGTAIKRPANAPSALHLLNAPAGLSATGYEHLR